jgi:hypothetical protein
VGPIAGDSAADVGAACVAGCGAGEQSRPSPGVVTLTHNQGAHGPGAVYPLVFSPPARGLAAREYELWLCVAGAAERGTIGALGISR